MSRLKRRALRLTVTVVVVMIAVLVVYLHTPAFRKTLERRVTEEISRQLGRDCRLSLVGLRPFALSAEVEDLWIAGAVEGDPAFLELDRVRIDAGWRLLTQQRLDLSEISVSGFRIHLDQLPTPQVDEAVSTSRPMTFQDLALVEIDRATVSDGFVSWASTAVPLSFTAGGLSLLIERSEQEDDYRLRLEVDRGALESPTLGALPFRAGGEGVLAASGLRVTRVELEGAGIDLRATGELSELAELAGSAEARLEARAEELAPMVPALDDVDGKATVEAASRFSRSGVQFAANLTSSRLSWRGWSADDVRLVLNGSNEGWSSTLSTSVLGVELQAESEGVTLSTLSPFDSRVSFHTEDMGRLLAATLGSDASSISGSTQGWLDVRVEAFEPGSVKGSFFLESQLMEPGRRPVERLSSNLTGSIADGRIAIERLRAQGMGVNVEGRGFAELEGRTELQLDLKVQDAGKTIGLAHSMYAGTSLAPSLFEATSGTQGKLEASVTIDAPGIQGMALDAIGGIVDIEARGITLVGADGLPLDAHADLALKNGRFSIREFSVRGPGVGIDGYGWVDLDRTLAVQLGAEVERLGDTAGGLLEELRVLGIATPYAEQVARARGGLDLNADAAGSWSKPNGRLTLFGDELGVEGVDGRRSMRVEANVHDGRLDANARIEGVGSLVEVEAELAPFARPTEGFVAIELLEDSPDWWAAVVGVAIPIQGAVEASARYELSTGTARSRLDIRDGAVSGFPFELHHGVVNLSRERIEIERAELRTPGGVVAIHGDLGSRDGVAQLRVHSHEFDLGKALQPYETAKEVDGVLNLDAYLSGTPSDPKMLGQLSLVDLTVSGKSLPPLAGELSFAEGTFDLDLAEPDGDSSLTLRAQLKENVPWALQLRYPLRVDLSSLIDIADSSTPAYLEALVLADLVGQSMQLDAVEGEVELRDARLRIDEKVLLAEDGPRIELRESRARIAPFRIEGGGVALDAEGDLPFAMDQPIAVRVSGELPMALLSGSVPDLRLKGDSELEVRLSGTLAVPEWKGNVLLRQARLAYPALPAALEDIDATIVLTGPRWSIEEFSARIGGGRLTATGAYVPAGEQAGRLVLEMAGEGIRIPLIEGLRSEFDADLKLQGKIEETLALTGVIRFERAAYVQDIDLKRQLRARVRAVAAGTEVGGVLDRIRLDLVAEAPGTLSVRNNLASIDTTASLKIGGTAADPLVTGEVAVDEGGRVFFRDVTYFVSRGSLEYVSDPPSNPMIDIEAYTSVSKYEVNLRLTGRLEDPKSELSSDPPLSQTDIVSLLVTGRTRDEFGGAAGGIAESQAALYLGGGFTRETEKALKKSLGLDQVRIDPTLVAGETDPTARVTLGKTVTARTSVTYSRSLGGAQDDIYQLRYEPSPHLSILGMRDEDGEQSVDAVHTRRFFVGPPAQASSASTQKQAERKEQPIVRLEIEGAAAIPEKQLRREMGLRKGEYFRRARLLAALDAVRERYTESGFPEAQVTADVNDEERGIAITTTIEEGRRVTVDIKGAKNPKEIRKAVLASWERSVFVEDIAEEASVTISRVLADRGFVNAQVSCELVDIGPTGARFQVEVLQGPRIRVDRIVIEGNREIQEERIRAEILTDESGRLTPKWLSSGVLEDDREAVRALYLGLGYLDVVVGEFELAYPDAVNRAVVRVAIEEGRRYRIGTVEFSGNRAFEGDTLAKTVGLRSEAPYVDAELRAARAAARGEYDRHGFPDVIVNVNTAVRRDDARVDVRFEIDEGQHKTIESVEVAGARLTRPKTIQRELELAAGDPLSADEVAKTKQRLYRTGLFRSIAVVEEPGESEEQRRLTFEVEERPNVRTDYGLGMSSDDGIRGSATVSHSNLAGRRLHGSLGGRASQNDWRLFALLRQPTLFGSSLQGLASTFFENEKQESFDIRRIGTTLQIDSKPENRRLQWFAGYGLEAARILRDGVIVDTGGGLPPELADLIDPRQKSTVRLGNLYTGFVAGTSDDLTWPTRGNVLRSKLAFFSPAFLSEAEFVRGFSQWSFYRKLNGRLIWSSGMRLGLADTYGGTVQIPLSERFFGGGDNSIRGFKRDSIVAVGFPTGQLAAAGVTAEDSLGGNTLFVLNQELVAPLFDPLAVVAFYDAGNLYWRIEDFDLTDLRHAAGLGLRMKTPAGPLRLEYAWKLDRQPDESSGRLHFSIGIPF